MSAEAFPLSWPTGWPRTPAEQRRGGKQFMRPIYNVENQLTERRQIGFAKARDLLFSELRRLGATSIILSSNHRPDRTGLVVENARKPADDSVAIYFVLNGKRMSMGADRFTSAAANMRSLGLAIEAMNQLERHGGGVMMERAFSGFAALPPPSGGASTPQRSWREVFGFPSHMDVIEEQVELRFKRLSRERHPDRGGSSEAMSELNVARADALKYCREQTQ